MHLIRLSNFESNKNMPHKTDIEIARAADMKPIEEIGELAGIPANALYRYGPTKAKVSAEFIKTLAGKKSGKLILVTAISPTPAGEGKTTTSVGLGDGLRAIGKNAMIALREPSLGPCFGTKGGAAGGGLAQVVPWKTSICTLPGIFTPSGRPTICWRP